MRAAAFGGMILKKLHWALAAALVMGAPMSAYAADDDEGEADHRPDKDTGEAKADHAAKTLPDTASDKAKANAFGQQGARMRAAHQAAQAEGARHARDAAEHGPPGGPNHHADHHAHSHGAGAGHGQGKAVAASHGQSAGHPNRH